MRATEHAIEAAARSLPTWRRWAEGDHPGEQRHNHGSAIDGERSWTGAQVNEDWTDGPYVVDKGNFLADLTGDGKADAIVDNG